MNLINDVVQFVKHFWSVASGVLKEYGFHNLLVLLIALYFYFLVGGGLSNHIASILLGVFIGLNVVAFNAVYKKLRDKNGW